MFRTDSFSLESDKASKQSYIILVVIKLTCHKINLQKN